MSSVQSQISVTLDGPWQAARRARRTVQQLLGDEPSIAFIRDAILVTGELVTTATIASNQCELVATYESERLRVEIADVSALLPNDGDEHEHGDADLNLVSRIVSRWGTNSAGNRAVIWFEMDERDHRPTSQQA